MKHYCGNILSTKAIINQTINSEQKAIIILWFVVVIFLFTYKSKFIYTIFINVEMYIYYNQCDFKCNKKPIQMF